ncbi:hypothetical protein DYB36_002481 [Aphanomyces astaci]|uniref:PDZ domain-containing protein n=1 Tax=Aphanomyces astaci TaxID=112090 RepID=A0A397B537_APHAT|nr:hypothetical protein DYB36_002481 [Aphanomyces astaci]
MRGLHVLAALCLLTFSTSNIYFEVPFSLHQYTMTAILVDSFVHLRVHSVIDSTDRVCNTTNTSLNFCSINLEPFHVVAPSDRLVAVDMHAISIKSFEDVADAAAGMSYVLPLFDDPNSESNDQADDDVRVLSGFVRLTVVHPSVVTFEPSQRRRSASVHSTHADSPYDNVVLDDPDDSLRFHLPFSDLVARGCRVEAVYVQGAEAVHLRVASIDGDSTHPSSVLDIAESDRLVAADTTPITLQQLDNLLDSEPGTLALLPLVDTSEGQGNQLTGFILVELVRATTLVFEPMELSRVTALEQVLATNPSHPYVHMRDDVYLHGNVNSPADMPPPTSKNCSSTTTNRSATSKDKNNIIQKPKVDLYQLPLVVDIAQDDDDKNLTSGSHVNGVAAPQGGNTRNSATNMYSIRIEDTPNAEASAETTSPSSTAPDQPSQQQHSVADQRKLGLAFEFDVAFPTKTRLGINWDADIEDRTVIDSIEPHSPAAALDCLEPRDHLVAINGINVSTFGRSPYCRCCCLIHCVAPPDVVPVYIKSVWPKTLRFSVGASTPVAPPAPPQVNQTVPPVQSVTETRHHEYPLTAHADVPRLRRDGEAFWYEVTLPELQTPVGIYWDLHNAMSSTVVHAIEPGSIAHRLQVIHQGDQLLLVNDANVTALGPRDALARFKATHPPRTLLLYCPPVDSSSTASSTTPLATSTEAQAPTIVVPDLTPEDPKVEARRLQWQLVPLSSVRSARQSGDVVQYEIQVTSPGPIGIVWDRLVRTKTEVKSVDVHCRFPNVVAGDHLVGINDKNVSAMGPQQVVVWYTQASFPKRLVFRTSSSAAADSTTHNVEATAEPHVTHLVVQAPSVLKDWVLPLDMADWSTSMTTTNVTLVPATPASSCFKLSLPQMVLGDVVVVVAIRGGCSFTDKAHHVLRAQGDGLLLANNVAGPGVYCSRLRGLTRMSRDEGDVLLAVLAYEFASAMWQRLPKAKSTLLAPSQRHSDHSAPLSFLLWHVEADTARTVSMAYMAASFGTPVRESQPFQVVLSTPVQTACHRDDVTVRGKGSVVVVKHGTCSFTQKAKYTSTRLTRVCWWMMDG